MMHLAGAAIGVRADDALADESAGHVRIRLLADESAAETPTPPAFEIIGPLRPPAEPLLYLPPLEQELAIHGGSYLNESIDSIRARHEMHAGHAPPEYLPENWPRTPPPSSADPS